MALLDAAAQRLLDRLRLRVRPAAAGTDHGEHLSLARANGLQFSERREYVPGDDARSIDWNAFARDRSLTVRTFEEEHDTHVYVLVDVSGSMTRGAPPKIDLARRIAASFGYLGLRQVDRAQVIPFADTLRQGTTALRCKDQYPALDGFLCALRAEGATTFAETTHRFLERYPRRGYVVVVSDLKEAADWSASLRALMNRGHQLCVTRVRCNEDHAPDLDGELELTDAETGETVRVTVTAALLAHYRNEVGAHVDRVRATCRAVGATFVEASVETPFEATLRQVLGPALERT